MNSCCRVSSKSGIDIHSAPGGTVVVLEHGEDTFRSRMITSRWNIVRSRGTIGPGGRGLFGRLSRSASDQEQRDEKTQMSKLIQLRCSHDPPALEKPIAPPSRPVP